MKINKIKILALLAFISSGLTSCLKDNAFLNVSNTQPIIEFSKGTPSTTLSSWGTLKDTSVIDTAIAVDIASPQVLDYDVTVTIKMDTTLITTYNAFNPGNQLNKLPDSCYKLATTTVTIPAGYRIGRIPLKLYPQKISGTISYAMPFVIAGTTQSGQSLIISANAGSLMYAFIGNPIAGNYSEEWMRWSNTSGTGNPSYDLTVDNIFLPNTPTEAYVQSQENGLVFYIDFNNNSGTLSNFTATIDPNSYSGAGLATLLTGPTITVSSDYKVFTITFSYLNTSGAGRYIKEIFTKQ